MEIDNSRRDFVKKTAILTASTIVGSTIFNNSFASQKTDLPEDLFTQSPLPYSFDALEPHIDTFTMEIHYTKHHKAYITNLNTAIGKLSQDLRPKLSTLEDIFNNIDSFPDTIRNNAGGHYNHTLFWTMMKPNGGGMPKAKLAEAINQQFGSFENFKKEFSDASAKRFGSGWCWLVLDQNKLKIDSTPNQDNPLMNLKNTLKGKPILALDVWEHAYYLKNQNRRIDYINSFWNVVNWDTAEELFLK